MVMVDKKDKANNGNAHNACRQLSLIGQTLNFHIKAVFLHPNMNKERNEVNQMNEEKEDFIVFKTHS